MSKKKSAADFRDSISPIGGLYKLLESCSGVPSFGERGASFRLGGKGDVLVRLELQGGPGVLLNDDTLWVSMEVAHANLSPELCKKLKGTLAPLSKRGKVHLHVPLSSLSEQEFDHIRLVLSECFAVAAST